MTIRKTSAVTGQVTGTEGPESLRKESARDGWDDTDEQALAEESADARWFPRDFSEAEHDR